MKDAINAALQARFIELMENSGEWPCDFAHALAVKLAPASGKGDRPEERGGGDGSAAPVAEAEFDAAEMQDLGDAVPALLDVKARFDVSLKFQVRLTLGDGEQPSQELIDAINKALADTKLEFFV